MGGFGVWHWIIVLLVLAIPVGIGLVVWLIVRAARRRAASSRSTTDAAATPQPSAEARLQELASLRSKGLITDSEFEQQRSAVLRGVEARAQAYIQAHAASPVGVVQTPGIR